MVCRPRLRVARVPTRTFFSGLHQDAGEILGTTFDIAHSGDGAGEGHSVLLTCEHHLVPFHGVAHGLSIPGPDEGYRA